MKKSVEVYFIIYLATIVSFFAIEAEVREYQKRQNEILLQVASDKINSLIDVDRIMPYIGSDSLRLDIRLLGDYDPNTLKGEVFFNRMVDSNNSEQKELYEDFSYSFPLEKKTDEWYFMRTNKKIFGDHQDKSFSVTLNLNMIPHFTHQTIKSLTDAFGEEKIAQKIILNIKSKGEVTLIKRLSTPIIPRGGGPESDFVMEIAEHTINVIKGLQWEIPIFIGGVRNKDDFSLVFLEGKAFISDENIDAPQTTFYGPAINDGRITILGRRLEDGQTDQVSVDIHVVQPRWLKEPVTNEIYLKEEYFFNGRLEEIKSSRISMIVTGKPFPKPTPRKNIPGATFVFGPFEKEGKLEIQMLVNDIPIPNIIHMVRVVKPPKPKIRLLSKEGNTLKFQITTFGKGNKIKKFKRRSGIKSHEIVESRSLGDNKTLEILLITMSRPMGRSVSSEVAFDVIDNNSEKSEHRQYYQYL